MATSIVAKPIEECACDTLVFSAGTKKQGSGRMIVLSDIVCEKCHRPFAGAGPRGQILLHPALPVLPLDAVEAPVPAKKPLTTEEKIQALKDSVGGDGPGFRLSLRFFKRGFPSCQACVDLAKKMNAWGDECGDHFDEIVEDILPRAKTWLANEKPWAKAVFGAVGVEDVALRAAIHIEVSAALREWEKA